MWVNVPVAERKEGDVKNLLAQRGSKQEEVVEEIILNLVLLLRNLEEAYTHTHTNTRSLGSEDSAAVRSGLGDRLLNLVKNNVVQVKSPNNAGRMASWCAFLDRQTQEC